MHPANHLLNNIGDRKATARTVTNVNDKGYLSFLSKY